MTKKPLILMPVRHTEMPALPGFFDSSTSWNQKFMLDHDALPIMCPFMNEDDAETMVEMCDGLFLTGGRDVDPQLYGEEKKEYCSQPQRDRDDFEFMVLRLALKHKKPVIGICRGIQIINTYFGGTLYQDTCIDHGTELFNHFADYDVGKFYGHEKDTCMHPVTVVKDSPLYKLINSEVAYTNSLHHQAIKDLAPGLTAQGTAPDGIVESLYMDSADQYLRAYQWHPEFEEKNDVSDAIANDFIRACLDARK